MGGDKSSQRNKLFNRKGNDKVVSTDKLISVRGEMRLANKGLRVMIH